MATNFDNSVLQSKYIKGALVNSKFRFDVESFDLKFELKIGNSNESINFLLKLQNSSLGVSAYLMMGGTYERSLGPFSEKLV